MSSNEAIHSFPEAPAPWHCKGEMFWFLTYTSSAAAKTPLPSSAFSPLEESSFGNSQNGTFKGGLGTINVVRYTETPVGPYDEIIYTPGKFTVPPTGQEKFRITRIYVSTKASVFNGRRNWNIPKAVAHFTFHPAIGNNPSSLPYSRIDVASPEDPENPFFVAHLSPTRFLSAGTIPFSSAFAPLDFDTIIPPLPQSDKWKEDALVGTDHWWSVAPDIKGKLGFFWSEGGIGPEKRYGDDRGFPAVTPFKLGFWLNDMELEFGVGCDPVEKKKML